MLNKHNYKQRIEDEIKTCQAELTYFLHSGIQSNEKSFNINGYTINLKVIDDNKVYAYYQNNKYILDEVYLITTGTHRNVSMDNICWRYVVSDGDFQQNVEALMPGVYKRSYVHNMSNFENLTNTVTFFIDVNQIQQAVTSYTIIKTYQVVFKKYIYDT